MPIGSQLEKTLRQVVAVCSLSAGALALLALVGWVFGNWKIGALGNNYVPMAPSTALMLILLSSGLVLQSRWPDSRAARRLALLAGSSVGSMSLLVWSQRFLGYQLPVERWLAPATAAVGAIPVSLTSPLTALTVLPAAVALIFELPPFSRHRLSRWMAPTLALGALLASLAVLLSYAAGLSLLYGSRTIPMALPAAVSLVLLSCGILAAAGPLAWPIILLEAGPVDSTARRPRWSVLGPLALLLFLLLATGIAGSFHLRELITSARLTAEREVSAMADSKAAQIAEWWRERRTGAAVIFRTPMIQARALEFLSGSAPAGQELLAWMEMQRELNNYRQLILYDARGMPRLSAPADLSIPSAAHNQYFQATLRAKDFLTADLHTYGEAARGQPPLVTLSLWIPLGLKPGTEAPAQGALLIENDPYQFLYPLIQSWHSSSRTAETLLIRREGDQVVYLNELRHRAGTGLFLRLPIDRRRSLPAALAAMGQAGVVEGEDYRGAPVLAAVRGVPSTPWFMVAKVDQEEVYAPYRRGAWMTMIVLLALVLATTLGVGLLWRQRDNQWFREQQAADRRLNAELEERVKDRTIQLEASNRELEAFCYSVSHDLRAPLRGIDGWSMALLEDYRDKLDEQGCRYLERVRYDTQRMGRLIDDLLLLSRVARGQIQRSLVDLTAIAQSVAARLQEAEPERPVEFTAQAGLTAQGDARLLEIVLSNLLGNAWKFSGRRPLARVEFGRTNVDGRPAYFVRDNGVGFDMTYAQKLFGAFQRMHKESEFPGTGIGLATVRRVIHRHGGRVWAEAQVDRGATFYFTLEEEA